MHNYYIYTQLFIFIHNFIGAGLSAATSISLDLNDYGQSTLFIFRKLTGISTLLKLCRCLFTFS